MSAMVPFQRGFVSLVGAGPGHPDLLTLRGLRVLQAAEVILYDALLDPAYHALFPPRARAINVGKRCGGPSLSQAEIHQVLLREAHLGRRVVRLKGGDPFVFGRGGEEALLLQEAGIPFEIVPGVSALNGAAAAAGIPLTHRGLAREVRVIEGHSARLPEAWRELAAYPGTLAIFMGSQVLAEIATRLLEQGAPEDWPVALVENGCTDQQIVSRGTLRDASSCRLRARTEGPGLVLMGPTIPLHDLLSPFLKSCENHVPAAADLPETRWSTRAARRSGQRRAG